MCAKLAHFVTEPNGYMLCAIETSLGECIAFCAFCGAYATANPRGLRRACTGSARKPSAGYYTLRRLAAGRHPVHSCKATTEAIAPLGGHFDHESMRKLEDRLELLSRAKIKSKRGDVGDSGRLMCPAASEITTPLPSAAQQRLASLRQRIQAKSTDACESAANRRPGGM